MTTPKQAEKRRGLSVLPDVPLSPVHQQILDRIGACCGGQGPWRERKLVELREVLALAQVSGRFLIVEGDAREALKLLVLMRASVPCLLEPNGELQVGSQVCLGISYQEAALSTVQSGASFVQVLAPRAVWHPNVDPQNQALCLGHRLPRGIRVRELILLSYGALTLQNIGLGGDGHGVMNRAAALWWLACKHRIPLTRETFFSSEDR